MCTRLSLPICWPKQVGCRAFIGSSRLARGLVRACWVRRLSYAVPARRWARGSATTCRRHTEAAARGRPSPVRFVRRHRSALAQTAL